MTDFITRFAPSPTGQLHLGHAASALAVWRAAEAAAGRVLLRIEDVDTTRCRPEYTDAILEDLAWLGFEWTEPVRVQSDHFADYAAGVQSLAERGLAYRCFRTRQEVAAAQEQIGGAFIGGPLPADEEARHLEARRPFAWRLHLQAVREHLGSAWSELSYQTLQAGELARMKADPAQHGDIVIARKDSPSAYHLAATHDDALQGITHIVRGEDLIDAPHIQVVLQALMGWPTPLYIHHPLILGADGKRLSKTDKSTSLQSLRGQGYSPGQIWQRLGLS